MAVVELVGLTKKYAGHVAVSEVNLKIASGEFFSLLGPSGCGKSTTLRMVAGFVTPDDGRIFIDGDDIVDRPPEKRAVWSAFVPLRPAAGARRAPARRFSWPTPFRARAAH